MKAWFAGLSSAVVITLGVLWVLSIPLGIIDAAINKAAATEHRGIDMPVNRTGYHMVVVIEDPTSHGKHVSMIDDKTEEECATATIAIQRLVPEAQVCCYHTPEQAKACGQR